MAILGPHNKYEKLNAASERGRRKPRMTQTRLIKERLLAAFHELGGLKGLVRWARLSDENRRFVYGSIFKQIPVEQHIASDNKLTVRLISAVPRPPARLALPAQPETRFIESKAIALPDLKIATPGGEEVTLSGGRRFRKKKELQAAAQVAAQATHVAGRTA